MSPNIREMAWTFTPKLAGDVAELGGATDPEEGGALGWSAVEHFRAGGERFTLVSSEPGRSRLRRREEGVRVKRLDVVSTRRLRADPYG